MPAYKTYRPQKTASDIRAELAQLYHTLKNLIFRLEAAKEVLPDLHAFFEKARKDVELKTMLLKSVLSESVVDIKEYSYFRDGLDEAVDREAQFNAQVKDKVAVIAAVQSDIGAIKCKQENLQKLLAKTEDNVVDFPER